MPESVLLPLFQFCVPLILPRDLLEGVEDPWHHALEATKVDVSTGVDKVENLASVSLEEVLHVHLPPVLILHLPADGVLRLEPSSALPLHVVELPLVEQSVRCRYAQVHLGGAVVQVVCYGVFNEDAVEEGSEGSYACSCSHHDNWDGVLDEVWGQEHSLTDRTCNSNLIPLLQVAQEPRANPLFLLHCVPVVVVEFRPPNAKAHGVSSEGVAVAG
mmetsp:Transcript_14768/g.30391  ORF Transcript_14768/g.30391 Transcript_14768/m.30391 type:complete len:216 (-) Transcript_14768:656-1303(-)